MYGLITRLTTVAGRREAVLELLAHRTDPPEGCLSYVAARDVVDADTVWVTEVWVDREAHAAALKRPDIKAGFGKALGWIATMHDPVITEPVGGIGLDQAASAAETTASTVPSAT